MLSPEPRRLPAIHPSRRRRHAQRPVASCPADRTRSAAARRRRRASAGARPAAGSQHTSSSRDRACPRRTALAGERDPQQARGGRSPVRGVHPRSAPGKERRGRRVALRARLARARCAARGRPRQGAALRGRRASPVRLTPGERRHAGAKPRHRGRARGGDRGRDAAARAYAWARPRRRPPTQGTRDLECGPSGVPVPTPQAAQPAHARGLPGAGAGGRGPSGRRTADARLAPRSTPTSVRCHACSARRRCSRTVFRRRRRSCSWTGRASSAATRRPGSPRPNSSAR